MRVAVFGEGMVEGRADGSVGYGGDAINTAVYLARQGAEVSLITALGREAASETMLAALSDEGLGLAQVLRHPTRRAGRYDITLDARGERKFTYDRDTSAARAFFDLPGAEAALAAAAAADVLYLTGITLSLYLPAQRARIARLADSVRTRGGHVAFDPNYRPAGWPSAAEAWQAMGELAPHVTIALPSIDDHRALAGDAAPEAALERWRALGPGEVVLKLGEAGALISSGEAAPIAVAPVRPERLVDTTAAGDAFNAAYLAARIMRGDTPGEAGEAGAALAAKVIGWPGAIAPRAGSRA